MKIKSKLKKMNKGISPFLSHTMVVAFSAFLIIVVISTMNTITDEYRTYFSGSEINQFCFTIRSGIEKIYSIQAYNPQTNTTYGEIIIDLPEKITDMNYRASFSGKNITITALNTQKNTTCQTGFDINFTGSTTGGLTKLEYKYYANGTRIIEMSKV
jgi:hypothetical protein